MAEHINVFISSTSKDLQDYRKLAKQAVSDLDAFPVAMEEFTADKANALKKCYDAVQKAEVFIGIYAHRYGFAPPTSMQFSTDNGVVIAGDGATGITEFEYQWAVARDIPMLLYVVAEQATWNPLWVDDDPDKARLVRFKNAIRNQHIVPEFTSPENLAYQIATDLSKILAQFATQPHKSQRADFYQHKPLPDNYVVRQDLADGLRNALLSQQKRNTLALHGMGGIGKSVMARALCEDTQVQDAFPDGILWTTLGNEVSESDLVLKLREWISVLGGTISENVPTLNTLRANLGQLLATRACLLVVDDVWERKYAEVFRVGGEQCRLLLTTRDAEIARNMGADVQSIPSMSTDEAIDLLQVWASDALLTSPRNLLTRLVERMGRLPLAVKLAGAQLQRKDPEKWLETFEARKLASKRPEDVHDSLEQTFALSLDALSPQERHLYATLTIFREDETIPEVAIERLWQGLDDLETDETQEYVDDLAARALVELLADFSPRKVVLHDLLRDFMRRELDDAVATHQALLVTYQALGVHTPVMTGSPQTVSQWHTVTDDGYLYDHLAYHLKATQRHDDLKALFATPDWLNVRVPQRDYDYDGFISDLMIVWQEVVHPQVMAQIANGDIPTAMVESVRYALIRTSINSLAGNYAPELIARAFEVGLRSEKWAMGMAERKTEPYDRAQTYICLLKTRKLNAVHQAKAHEWAFQLSERNGTLLAQLVAIGNPYALQAVADGSLTLPNMSHDWKNLVEKVGVNEATERAFTALQRGNIMGIVAVLGYLEGQARHDLLQSTFAVLFAPEVINVEAFNQLVNVLTPPEVLSIAETERFIGVSWQSLIAWTSQSVIAHLPDEDVAPLLANPYLSTNPEAVANLLGQPRTPHYAIFNELRAEGGYVHPASYYQDRLKKLRVSDLKKELKVGSRIAFWFKTYFTQSPKVAMDEAFALVMALENKQDFAEALFAVAPRLNEQQLQQALQAVSEIKRYTWSRAVGLAALAPYLTGDDQSTVIADGLNAARSLEFNAPRAKALRLFLAVAPQHAQILREIRESIASFWLSNADSKRETVLLFLATDDLFGEQGVYPLPLREALAHQINEICNTWQWL